MTDKEVNQIIAFLTAAYPHTDWGEGRHETMKAWRNILSVFPYVIGVLACKQYVRRGERFFPTVSVLAGLCDALWKEAIQKEKNEAMNGEWSRQLPPPESSLAFGKKCCQLILDLCDDKLTRREYINRGRQIGMDMADTERFYEKRGLDLNEKPIMARIGGGL